MNKKIVILNTFSDKSKYIGREVNSGEVKIDYTIPVPSLREYVEKFCNFGISANYGEIDEDNSEEFSPKDFRNSDIEDLKDYNEEMQKKVKSYKKTALKTEKKVDVNQEEKKQKDSETTEK